ncbi:MAG: hypothetical protein ABI972_06345 [Acidobacteriota bacterium]
MLRRESKLLLALVCLVAGLCAWAADYRPPAADRPAVRRPGAESVLPGGRVITPLGQQYPTGPGPFGLALNPSGDTLVTADGGPSRYSLTVLQKDGGGWRTSTLKAEGKRKGDADDDDETDWRSVFQGLAFASDREIYASEGNSGRVRLVDARSGSLKQLYELNTGEFKNSYSGDLALDNQRGLLYVLDQANFRLVVIDTKKKRVAASLRTGRLPFAIALSPDARRVYVTHVGMFEYKVIPGADPKRSKETGLPFPAFGFPSQEARDGARRPTEAGMVDVPGLGDPNARESNSLAVVDVENPAAPKVLGVVRTGKPFGGAVVGGASPSGVVATQDRIFVSNANQDSVSVINALTLRLERDIEIRAPGMESLRGILPIGLHYEPTNQWILAAEAGINAVGVIDAGSLAVIGHIPAAWFPTRTTTRDGRLFVASAKGHGTGPNASRQGPVTGSFQGELRRGALSIAPLPGPDELPALTRRVWANNGLLPAKLEPTSMPADLDHVVIIVKENRTFDEVLGDIETAANGPVESLPPLARFGKRGVIVQQKAELRQRLGLRFVNITPNTHALAQRFAFSDNFYADSEVSVDGHHWIVGSYPNAWTESTLMAAYGGQKDFRLPPPGSPGSAPGRLSFPQSASSVHPEEQLEAGALWHHLERYNIPFRNYGEGFELAGIDEGKGLKPTGARFLTNMPMPTPLYRNSSLEYPGYNMNIPDQFRANQFINEIDREYIRGGKPLPRLIFIHLPNDHTTRPRPEDGYPFNASYVADNDHALGRIVQYLSQTPYWKRMAILITEDDAQGGVDHIDSHRTLFLAASPWAKKNYCSHANASFPALLKLAFRILRIPPLNLYDAAAADLSHLFTDTADDTPYSLEPSTLEVFDPAKAREPLDPQPSPRMDDPRVLREQHRNQQP